LNSRGIPRHTAIPLGGGKKLGVGKKTLVRTQTIFFPHYVLLSKTFQTLVEKIALLMERGRAYCLSTLKKNSCGKEKQSNSTQC
jgi:hypothetical protein